jgi:adenine-specific DNA-methyltransferase
VTHRSDQLAAIEAHLGPPKYRGPGVLIYHGDCIELMAAMDPTSFDLTVTSPPYNIGKEYERRRPIDEYLEWSQRWIEQVYRLTNPTGAFWLNLGYLTVPGRGKAMPLPYLLWDRIPFQLIQEIVWNYGAGVAARHSFSPRNEKLLWYVKDSATYTFNLDDVRDTDVKYPHQKKNGKLRCNPLGKNPSDVWQIPKVTSGTNRSSPERMPHPAQFPVALIERIVRACSNVGDLILDPFLGSGTTAEVAVHLGRRVVGFDIDASYVAAATDRLATYLEYRDQQTGQRALL